MIGVRSTHTFAELEVSPAAYDEIAAKLREADYGHAFVDDAIDMHGIGLVRAAEPALQPGPTQPPNRLAYRDGDHSAALGYGLGIGALIVVLLMLLGGYMVTKDIRAADRAEVEAARGIISEELRRMR